MVANVANGTAERVSMEHLRGEAPQFKLFRVATLRRSPHNPPRRIAAKSLRPLVRSMSEVGLLYPILVSTDNAVIDGHRRLAAAEELGWETISGLVVKGDADVIYASVNATARRTTGNDALVSWLANPHAAAAASAKRFADMQEGLGRKLLQEIADRGLTAHLWKWVRQIARYTSHETKDDYRSITRWLLDVMIVNRVVDAMASGLAPVKIWNAVSEMKPLRFVSRRD